MMVLQEYGTLAVNCCLIQSDVLVTMDSQLNVWHGFLMVCSLVLYFIPALIWIVFFCDFLELRKSDWNWHSVIFYGVNLACLNECQAWAVYSVWNSMKVIDNGHKSTISEAGQFLCIVIGPCGIANAFLQLCLISKDWQWRRSCFWLWSCVYAFCFFAQDSSKSVTGFVIGSNFQDWLVVVLGQVPTGFLITLCPDHLN